MSTVYLHIGLPKTATSTVQSAIQQLRAKLDARGFWTPLGIMAHHRFAIGGLDDDDPRLQLPHYRRVLASGNEGVFAEFEAAVRDRKSIIVSSEYLNACGAHCAADLLARFGVAPADARIVVCLRRQDRFLESSYNQEVKRMGRTRKLVWSRAKTAPWDWYQKLSAWGDTFGDAALRVLIYERIAKQAPGIMFARAVLGACDLDFEAAELEALAAEADDFANASLPAELVEFKRAANGVTAIGEADWLTEKAMAAGMAGTKFRMDPELAAEIIEFYKPSNAEVARRFLGESGALFDDFVEPQGRGAPVRKFDARVMSQLLGLMAAEIGALRTNLRARQRRARQQSQS